MTGDVFADPVAAAQAGAEAVRALNHATTPAASGLAFPADAQAVLAALGMATARLPQALAQLRRFLDEQITTGRVRVVDGEHAGDPAAMLAETSHLLDHATIAARGLAHLLDATADTLTWAAATALKATPTPATDLARSAQHQPRSAARRHPGMFHDRYGSHLLHHGHGKIRCDETTSMGGASSGRGERTCDVVDTTARTSG